MLIRRISLILAAFYFTSHLFLAGCATTDDEDLAEDDDTEEVSDENSEENGEETANEENSNQNSDGDNEFAENNEEQGNEEDNEGEGDEDNLAEDNFDNSGEDLAESTNQDLQQMINEAEAENTASAGEAPIDPLPENNVASAPANDVPMNNAGVVPETTEASTASAGFALPEMGSKMPYIIQAGDTLESVAGRIYGNPSKWVEIQELSSIQNPNNVHPGDVVYYQLTNDSMAFASSYEGLARSEVVVKSGDTLSGLAQELTGSYENWKSIWRQNDSIENPDQISVGQRIYYVNSSLLNATINFVKNVKVANILNIDTNKNDSSVNSDSNSQQQDNNQKSVKSTGKTLSQLSVKSVLSDFGFSMNFAS